MDENQRHRRLMNARGVEEESNQVLIFLRFALRAFALAGRRPWFAFLSLCCGFAIEFHQ
jgi:hypothetical protein